MTATSLSGVYAEEPVQETAEEVVQEEVSQEIVPQEEAVSEEPEVVETEAPVI